MPTASLDETFIIAENDSMMRGALRTMLAQPRRTLLLCADGMEAVEFARQVRVTIVLLDLRMPRMGGIEACLRIRELTDYASVPVVIMTVFDGDTLKQRAFKAGATSFLAKPFSRKQLLEVINPLIERHKIHA